MNDVRAWMIDNQIKVNDDKRVALVLSSRNNRANHNITEIKIGVCDVTPRPTGRNIGVIFDSKMLVVSHIKHICCTSYYSLRNYASIQSCLAQKATVRLVNSLVCLLCDLPDCLISKLQRVQNAAARLVVRRHGWEYITHPISRETALASRGTARSVLNRATDVSCTTWTGATLHNRPARTKSY